jgi:hypothetical protein
MAQREPTYTLDVAETIDYKPLSLFAVAGVVVAAVYVTLLLIGAVAAYFKSEPFFEPLFLGAWGIVLASAGAVLSALGLWEIHNSEGTRAGTLLAKWGLALSLVPALGYFTYQSFTELAILQQANRFILEKDEGSGFLPRLQGTEADFRTAFLYTRDVGDRGVRPENDEAFKRFDAPLPQNPRGFWTQFSESPLVRAIRGAAPGTVKVEPLAVRNWAFENRAYHITRLYRISTDEAVYEIPLTVSSIEPIAEGEQRRWKLDWQPHYGGQLQPLARTDLGFKRQPLRQRAFEFLSDPQTGWFTQLRFLNGPGVYLGTRLPADRPELEARMAAILARTPIVAISGGAAVPPHSPRAEELLRSYFLPDYWPLSKLAENFKVESMRGWDPVLLAKAKAAATQALAPERLSQLALRVLPDEQAPWEQRNGEVLLTYQVEMVLYGGQKGMPDLLLLLKAVVAASEGLDPTAADAGQAWRVKSVEFVRALPIQRQN